MLDDTIIAISTPLGTGGLGIVRLSGKEALSISRRLFKPAREKQAILPRRPVLGMIFDDQDGEVFEQAVLTYFPAPRSYTTEDMIELSMHGSPVILEEVLRLGIRSGARHADKGEFTLRAFLGGRLDLIQAQAVNDIIRAPSLHQARISFRQIEGGLSRRLNSLRGRLVRLLSDVEVGIEFPEEEIRIPRSRILRTLERTRRLVEALVRSYDIGKSLAEGITLAVSGRPNVGKSTLFNALLGRDRAIVTPEPGTTRDYIKETCRIGDSIFSLIDTAGLDSPSNRAEREGIRRSKKLTGAADGALLVFDASRRETAEDIRSLHRRRGLPTLLVFNKSDLPRKIDRNLLIRESGGSPAQDVSALHGTGLDALREQITTTFIRSEDSGRDVILHLRQKLLLEEIGKGLDAGIRTMADGQPDEMLAEDLRAALEPAGRLLGEIRPDEILNRIFRQFCIGK